MRKFISYVSLILILFGMIGFLFNMGLSRGNLKYDGELPLTDIQGIKEKDNRIYVGIGVYNRIQVYDLEGNFVKYVNTNNFSKDYDFWIDDLGNPEINVIYSRPIVTDEYIQVDSSIYVVGSIVPSTIMKYDGLQFHTIIEQPIYMSAWAGMINPWVIAVFGVFLFLIINSLIIMEVYGKSANNDDQMRLLMRRIFSDSKKENAVN